jgi:YegS/Rv2252/BmrU family lipid kinase
VVPSPVCLIVNPSAGGGRSLRLAPAIEGALRGRGLTVRRVDTRDVEHARQLAREAAGAGETVLALSGDGLLGVLADVLREIPGSILGVLPGGRGNDLARVLEIPSDPTGAVAVVAEGTARPLDLGLVREAGREDGGRAFVGIASAGFDSDANRIANEAPAWLGGLVYAYGALRALVSWRPARFELELDSGERHTCVGYSVAVANSRAYGGGMFVAPDAMLDDGLLDIVVSERTSKLRFLTTLPRLFKGTHVQLPEVRVFRAGAVTVSADRPFQMYADGDPIGALPVRVSALAGAVTVITPPGGSPALAGAPRPQQNGRAGPPAPGAGA